MNEGHRLDSQELLVERLKVRINQIVASGIEIDEPFIRDEDKQERLFDLSLYPITPYSTLVILSFLHYLIENWFTMDEVDRDGYLTALPACLDFEDKLRANNVLKVRREIIAEIMSCGDADQELIASSFEWIAKADYMKDMVMRPDFERMVRYWRPAKE